MITGFHAIEERIRRAEEAGEAAGTLYYSAPAGQRVRNLLAEAARAGVPARETSAASLDGMARGLPAASRGHRGVILDEGGGSGGDAEAEAGGAPSLAAFLASREGSAAPSLVALLDSVTDPHNVGAALRSACQFGVELVIVPRRRALRGAARNAVVSRVSAGAAAWTPIAEEANLTAAARLLKEAGYWLYAADPRGEAAPRVRFADKTALVLGSEGSGISRLLAKECDVPVAIPMRGKLGSLNVSVAAGILFYEVYRQRYFAP